MSQPKETYWIILSFTIASVVMFIQSLSYLVREEKHTEMSIDRMNAVLFYWFINVYINLMFFYQFYRSKNKTIELVNINLIYYSYMKILNSILIIWLYYSLFGPCEQFVFNLFYFIANGFFYSRYHLYTLQDFSKDTEFLRFKKVTLL